MAGDGALGEGKGTGGVFGDAWAQAWAAWGSLGECIQFGTLT